MRLGSAVPSIMAGLVRHVAVLCGRPTATGATTLETNMTDEHTRKQARIDSLGDAIMSLLNDAQESRETTLSVLTSCLAIGVAQFCPADRIDDVAEKLAHEVSKRAHEFQRDNQ